MFRFFRQMSSQYKFLFRSYAILVIATISMSMLGYIYAYQTIKSDIALNFNAIMTEQSLSYDKELRREQVNVNFIASNSLIKDLAVIEEWETKDLFTAREAIQEIALVKGHKQIDGFGVYFYGNKGILTNTKHYSRPVADLYFGLFGLNTEQFSQQATSSPSGYFINQKNDGKTYIIFHQNIYNKNYTKVCASAFYVISWDSVQGLSGNYLFDNADSGVFLQHKNGITASSRPLPFADLDYNNFNPGEIVYLSAGGTSFAVSCIMSELLESKYYLYAPKGVFFNKINVLLYFILAELVCCIIIGGILAHHYAKKNALPIERILAFLKNQQHDIQDHTLVHLYTGLEKSLTALQSRHEDMNRQLSSSSRKIEQLALTSMLEGTGNYDWIEDSLHDMGKRQIFNSYRVLLFSFDNADESLFARSSDGKATVDYELLNYAFKNILDEVMLGYTHNLSEEALINGITLETADATACIVSLEKSGMDNIGKLENAVNQCIEFCQKALGLQVHATISGVHTGLEQLNQAYEEAFVMLMHKTFWGDSIGRVLSYQEEEKILAQPKTGKKLFEQAQKMSRQLLTRNYVKASEILDETVNECFYPDVHMLSVNQLQAMILLYYIGGILMENSDNPNDIANFLGNFTNSKLVLFSSLEEVRKILHDNMLKLYEAYEKDLQIEKEPKWLADAESYVKENFADEALNVSAIADKFNVSLAYMGQTFRKFRGISLLDYMHMLRIEQGKGLMIGGMSVTDTAKTTGYVDSKSFIRAFKRYEGITPGQFKNNAYIVNQPEN